MRVFLFITLCAYIIQQIKAYKMYQFFFIFYAYKLLEKFVLQILIDNL